MLVFISLKINEKIPFRIGKMMKKAGFISFLLLVCALLSVNFAVSAQDQATPQIKSQEVSEVDGIPVLIKHLPDWENVRNSATFTHNVEDLRKVLGDRPIFDLVDFSGGTEAVTAPYNQGKLLIIEYTTPQNSVAMDAQIQQRLAEIGGNQQIYYRRIGNYNTFVFDAPNEAAANTLLDQIKYEKDVRWLGEDPFLLRRAERNFILTTSDIFLSTMIVIVSGIGLALFLGLSVGIIYFYVAKQKRDSMNAFSDAGGMTRLNIDELTAEISPSKFLKD